MRMCVCVCLRVPVDDTGNIWLMFTAHRKNVDANEGFTKKLASHIYNTSGLFSLSDLTTTTTTNEKKKEKEETKATSSDHQTAYNPVEKKKKKKNIKPKKKKKTNAKHEEYDA